MEEERLIALAAGGDTDAFENLARAYQNKIYALALRVLGDRQDAFDASQEALIRLYRTLSSFSGRSAFATWVYRITKNVCIDILRRRKAEVPLDEAAAEAWSTPREEDPAEQAVRSEQRRRMKALIAALPRQQRQVVILRDVEGYAYQEIADILQLPLGTVKSRLKRARSTLMEEWRQIERGEGP